MFFSRDTLRMAPLFLATLSALTPSCSAFTVTNSLLLKSVSQQMDLPELQWSANGTHTARAYTSKEAEKTDVKGMHEDCLNINLNKKLAEDFRSDVLGDGIVGFFYKCERISYDTNKYWFTVSSPSDAQLDKMCDPDTEFPIVHDSQHDTWFKDLPFSCVKRTCPADIL